ncbi:MAG TPA: LysM peptidoglycan-binding domain-containing protein, partial [Ardenticatenaceae bacterium]|nr:LysM peptidoglycan-binding domain-containing protein [Ardenticatenaceae bacterium]
MDEPPSPRPRGLVRRLAVSSTCLVLVVVMSGCGSNIVDLPTAQPAVVREPVSPTFTPLPAATHSASATPLPPTPTASATPLIFPTPTPIIYTVQPRDTLNALAVHFGVSLEQLMSANGLTDPNFLQLGQQLIIPVVAPPVEGLPVVAPVGGVATSGAGIVDLAVDGSNVLHYVRVGETLSVI